MTILQHWDELATEGTSPVSKRRLPGAGASLVRVEIKAGTKSAKHSHAHEQFVQVISGRGTLETEEGRQSFTSGSLFHFPPETWHAAEFDDDTILVETNLDTLA